MKIRRYLGNNTQEAILKVKMDLGNDALILNTRRVRKKGLLGLFSKPMVEVLAAIDEYSTTKKSQDTPKKEEKTETDIQSNNDKTFFDEKEEKIAKLENKVTGMESLLQKIYDQMQPPTEKDGEKSDKSGKTGSIKAHQIFYNNLIKNEVDQEIAGKIAEMVVKKIGDNENVNETASVYYNIITGMLGKPDTLKLRDDGKPTVVMFVGPTGVGKTTTLAKVAANFALNHKKRVGFITADTYRIAAVEQLKTYAEILGIPVAVIYSNNEIKDAVSVYSDKDLILIDTAGRSYKNKAQFEELKSLINSTNADEIFLLLSATTSIRNSREILNSYSFLKNYKLVFTKLDEAPVMGIILNSRMITGKSISYITTGQSVPDDIEIANVDKISKNLLGSIT